MSKLFDDSDDSSDDEKELKVNKEYAKNYNNWRQKEELNKFKTKYGEAALKLSSDEGSSSSSDEDSDGELITEEFEKDFFKTLASLKKKDPKIYDENVRFFKESPEGPPSKIKKAKSEPMFIKDYERKLLLEKGGNVSGDEDENEQEDPRARSPTYIEEQKKLIEDLKKGLNNVDEEEDDTFKVREKTKGEITKEDDDYKEWLLGQKEGIEDRETQNELKPLKDFWTDPGLDKNEKFLRDYILNKRFLESDDKDYIPSYEEIVHDSDEGISEDEKEVERQDEFEHKYNYRFEEPDTEFIKRYPRTMENSLRKKDDRRKEKRAEVKERKQKEKEQKMEEIRKMKELKRKEIEEKLQKLREITGNTDMDFQDDDIDGDFDPDAHDKRMRNLFDDDFYQGEEGDEKPKFPDLDQELEMENWDQYEDGKNEDDGEQDDGGPHCEDDEFNMDCDYDPATSKKDLSDTKGKKKRKRKSNFAKTIQEPKPVFDPTDKTYEEYLDEYYKLDCEDIIDNIPCRFKYRKVIPNSFGLSIEEILMAKDRELNKWCSLKKAVQIRPDNVEKYEVVAYQKKGTNEVLKRKILPSLYQGTEENETQPSTSSQNNEQKQSKKRKSKSLQSFKVDYAEIVKELNEIDDEQDNNVGGKKETSKKKNKLKTENKGEPLNNSIQEESTLVEQDRNGNTEVQKDVPTTKKNRKKRKRNNENLGKPDNIKKKGKRKRSETDIGKNTKIKKAKIRKEKSNGIDISDSRLLAFGIKPKKFKNKMKYGRKQ